MKAIQDLIKRALKYIGTPSGEIKHLGGIQDDVIHGRNNYDAAIGLLKEALTVKRRNHEVNLIANTISSQLFGEACNSHKTDYMRKLTKDFADKFDQTISDFDRDLFFKDCGVKEVPY